MCLTVGFAAQLASCYRDGNIPLQGKGITARILMRAALHLQ